MQIRMMSVAFGQLGAFVEELDAGHEVFDFPIFADAPTLVRYSPAVELLELLAGFFRRIRIDAAFARFTFFVNELGSRLDVHDRFLRFEGKSAPQLSIVVEDRQLSLQGMGLTNGYMTNRCD